MWKGRHKVAALSISSTSEEVQRHFTPIKHVETVRLFPLVQLPKKFKAELVARDKEFKTVSISSTSEEVQSDTTLSSRRFYG